MPEKRNKVPKKKEIIPMNIVIAFSICRADNNMTSLNPEEVNSIIVRLAESVALSYYVSPLKGCIVLVAHPGYLEDFYVPSAAIFRISSEDFCSDEEAVNQMVKVFDEMCYNFVVQIPNVDCFFRLWLKAQGQTVQRPHPEIIFMPAYPEKRETADDVFTLKESDYSSSILAVDYSEEEEEWPFKIYTGNFYERVDKPGRNPKILLDCWSARMAFRFKANLMPDLITNLHNKTLIIMTFDYVPYIHIDPLDGTEIKMLREFCRRHNCSLETVDDGNFWGSTFENGTANGIAGLVHDGKADFGAAGVYLWIQLFHFVDYSTSYLYGAATLLVPKPHLISAWKTPFMPFDALTWISYGLSIVMAAAFMYIITALTVKYTRFAEKVRKRHMFLDKLDCVFRAIGLAVLQQPSSPLVPQTPIRHLFTSFEFLFLIISSIYSAELASYLTVPRYTKPIDTIKEMANSGMLWIGEQEAWTYSLRDANDPYVTKLVQNFRVHPLEELSSLAATGKFGLGLERLPGGYYTETDHVTFEVITRSHMMAENLFGSPIVLAIRKGSPYRKHLNRLISDVLRGGLYLYWLGDVSRKFLHSRKQLALKEAEHPHYKDEPHRLQISHVQGGLYLYGIGVIISTLVLVLEILVHRFQNSDVAKQSKIV